MCLVGYSSLSIKIEQRQTVRRVHDDIRGLKTAKSLLDGTENGVQESESIVPLLTRQQGRRSKSVPPGTDPRAEANEKDLPETG